jgi:hypothetical protein
MSLIIILSFAPIELIMYDIIQFIKFDWGHNYSFTSMIDMILYLY